MLAELVYDNTFDSIYKDLFSKKESSYFSKEDLEGLLNTLYKNQCSSQSGKSDLQQAKLSAAIAAHEAVLSLWDDKEEGISNK